MYRWFERYFAFNRRELTGICVLGVILVAIGMFPTAYRLWGAAGDEDMHLHMAEIEAFLATAEVRKPLVDRADAVPDALTGHALTVSYFPFDPNGLAVVDWERLGLSDRQIRMIKNYEAKGGRFRKKEDLKKIYAIHDADYKRLEPYIRIAEEKAEKPLPAGPAGVSERTTEQRKPTNAALLLELNTVDSIALLALPGIGQAFASRIVRFRDRLGGFHNVSQLMDVYGFDSVRFAGLHQHVYVDTSAVTKIDLNAAGVEQLKSHPLIGYKLANIIVQYRKQHGPYRSLGDLLHIVVIDESIFRKIAPYLTIADD